MQKKNLSALSELKAEDLEGNSLNFPSNGAIFVPWLGFLWSLAWDKEKKNRTPSHSTAAMIKGIHLHISSILADGGAEQDSEQHGGLIVSPRMYVSTYRWPVFTNSQ